MNEHYLGDNKAKLVADSAVWASEVFGIRKDPKSEVIGVGLIRENAFRAYGINLGKNQLLDLYQGIFSELDLRGYDWRLFSNGLPLDHELGLEILRCSGKDSKFLVRRPTTPEELVSTIASFKGLICCRLHACIIAYSLGVPSVALSWNDKVNFFMSEIGAPDRAVNARDFDPQYIVDKLEVALKAGFHEERRIKYRNSVRHSIREVVQNVLT